VGGLYRYGDDNKETYDVPDEEIVEGIKQGVRKVGIEFVSKCPNLFRFHIKNW
jgi:hypothetical protein